MSSAKYQRPKYVATWEDVTFQVDNVAESIKNAEYIPDIIIGIFRGGVIPAAMIQRKLASYGPEFLGDYHLLTVYAASYSPDHQRGSISYHIPDHFYTAVTDLEKDSKEVNVLLVDDLWDSGNTLLCIKNELLNNDNAPNIKTAVLFTKRVSGPDFYGSYEEPDTWIDFPWEE